jgi:hypothetical protein
MTLIREALGHEPDLWPGVPLAETLDQWLDDAVDKYIKAFIHGNKSNTGEGDNPESGVRASPYVDRAIDEELKAYVLEGVDKISEVKQIVRP